MRRLAHIGAVLAGGLLFNGCFLAHGQDGEPIPTPTPEPTPVPEPIPEPEPEPACTVFAIPGPRITFEDLTGEGTCDYGEIYGGGANLTAVEPAPEVRGITLELQRFTRDWPPYHCRFTVSEVGTDLAERMGSASLFVSGAFQYESARLSIPLDCAGPGCEEGLPVFWAEGDSTGDVFGNVAVHTSGIECTESSPGCFDTTFELIAGDPAADFAAVLGEGDEAAIDGFGTRWVRALRNWYPGCGQARGAFVFFQEEEPLAPGDRSSPIDP